MVTLTIQDPNYASDVTFDRLPSEGIVVYDLKAASKFNNVSEVFLRAHGTGKSIKLGILHDNTEVTETIISILRTNGVVWLESCSSDNDNDSLAQKIRNKMSQVTVYGFKTPAICTSRKYQDVYLMEGFDDNSPYYQFAASQTCSTTSTKEQISSCHTAFLNLQERAQDLSCSELIAFFNDHQSAIFCSEKDVILTIQLIQMHYNVLVNESIDGLDWDPILLFHYSLLLNSLPPSDQQKYLLDSFEKLIITKAIHLFNKGKFAELGCIFGRARCKIENDLFSAKRYDSLIGLAGLLYVQKFSYEKISVLKYAQNRINSQTLLMISIRNHLDDELIKQIIASSTVDVINAADTNKKTPLIFAVLKKNAALVEALLAAGANLDAQDRCGNTALSIALKNGDIQVVNILLKKMIEIHQYRKLIFDDRYLTKLFYIKDPITIELIKQIISRSNVDDINGTHLDKKTPLMIAVIQNPALVKAFLEAGANLEPQDKDGNTALILATIQGDATVVDILINAGANLEAKDMYGNTALISATKKGHLQVVKSLTNPSSKAKANLNATLKGRTALMLAAYYGDKTIVKALLHAGASVDLQTNPITLRDQKEAQKFTALMFAAHRGHETIVEDLLHAGALYREEALKLVNQDSHPALFFKLLLANGFDFEAGQFIQKINDADLKEPLSSELYDYRLDHGLICY